MPDREKRGYTRKGIRAFFTYTGSHSKTIIHGLLTTDGRGMFRQYDEFTKDTFADFLKQALYKFKKICLIMDRPHSTGQQRYANWLRRQTAWR